MSQHLFSESRLMTKKLMDTLHIVRTDLSSMVVPQPTEDDDKDIQLFPQKALILENTLADLNNQTFSFKSATPVSVALACDITMRKLKDLTEELVATINKSQDNIAPHKPQQKVMERDTGEFLQQ